MCDDSDKWATAQSYRPVLIFSEGEDLWSLERTRAANYTHTESVSQRWLVLIDRQTDIFCNDFW